MNILIADDDPVERNLLYAMLSKWGYEIIAVKDGTEAWNEMQKENSPPIVILDRQMPGMRGEEICEKAREIFFHKPLYIILITGALTESHDVIEGLHKGADDYITKPFIARELQARIEAGIRVITLEQTLAQRIKALEEMMGKVKILQGLLPICSYCKKIRDDKNYWLEVEAYITRHSEAQFSHGLCPDCFDKYYKTELENLQKKQ